MKKKLILSVLVSISPALYGAAAPSGEEVAAAALVALQELSPAQAKLNAILKMMAISTLQTARAEIRKQQQFILDICNVVTPESVAEGRVALSVAMESVITDPEVGACLAALKKEAMQGHNEAFRNMLPWLCAGVRGFEINAMPQTGTSVAHELAQVSGTPMPSDEQITAIERAMMADLPKIIEIGVGLASRLGNGEISDFDALRDALESQAPTLGAQTLTQHYGPEAAARVQAAIERKKQEVAASYATRVAQASPLSDEERTAMPAQKTCASLTPEEQELKAVTARERGMKAAQAALARQKEKKDKEEQGK